MDGLSFLKDPLKEMRSDGELEFWGSGWGISEIGTGRQEQI